MALPQKLPVAFELAFPFGAYALSVEPLNNFDQARAGAVDPQERDKDTGERLWVVRVMDPDPEARAAEVKVKIPALVAPVPPEVMPGTPFRPVQFEGMTVTYWVDRNGKFPKQAVSFRAAAMRPVAAAGTTRRATNGPAAGA